METAEKVRENRLRRVADRRGYQLEKCRRRDKLAVDYGLYRLTKYTDMRGRYGYGMSLDNVGSFLNMSDEEKEKYYPDICRPSIPEEERELKTIYVDP